MTTKKEIIQLKLDFPKLTLSEIKEKLNLDCSLSTISNYLQTTNLDKSDIYKSIDIRKCNNIFENIAIQIKQLNGISINNIQEKIFIVMLIDLNSGFFLSGFSFINTSEIPTLFLDYFISKIIKLKFNIKEIISSKNKIYYNKNKKSDIEQLLTNKYNLKFNPISNKNKIIDKLFKDSYNKICNFKKMDFISITDFQDMLFNKQLKYNMDILQNSSLKTKTINKLLKLIYSFEPLCYDDFLLNQSEIIENTEFWNNNSSSKFRIKSISENCIKFYKKKAENYSLSDKNNLNVKLDNHNWVLEIISNIENIDNSEDISSINYNKIKSEISISKAMIFYRDGKGKEANKLFHKSLSYAINSNDKPQIATAYYFLAEQYRRNGKRKKAKEYYEISLNIFTEINNKKGMGYVLGLLSALMKDMRQLSKALEYAKDMLVLVQEIDDTRQISIALNKIAIIYRNMKKYDEALEIYNGRLNFSKETDDFHLMCVCNGNISNIYSDLANYEQALVYQKKQVEVAEKIGHKILYGKGLSGLGNLYFKNNNIEMSLSNYSKSLLIFKKLDHKKEIYNCLTNLGDLNKAKGSILLARNYYKKAISIAEKINDRFLINEAMEKMKNRNKK